MALPQNVVLESPSGYIIYRDQIPGEPFDPTSTLSFFPPKGSDDLFDALRLAFPHLKTHSERMRDAIIQFLLDERQQEQQQSSPAMTTESFTSWPTMCNSASTSAFSTPELFDLATPSSFDQSPNPQARQLLLRNPSAATSKQPSPPSLDQMTGVFSLSTNAQPKQKLRRKMTEAEKIEYRKRRIVKACDKCAKRKRKCPHNQAQMETVPNPKSVAKVSKPSSARSKSQSLEDFQMFGNQMPDFQMFESARSKSQSLEDFQMLDDQLLDFQMFEDQLLDFQFDDFSHLDQPVVDYQGQNFVAPRSTYVQHIPTTFDTIAPEHLHVSSVNPNLTEVAGHIPDGDWVSSGSRTTLATQPQLDSSLQISVDGQNTAWFASGSGSQYCGQFQRERLAQQDANTTAQQDATRDVESGWEHHGVGAGWLEQRGLEEHPGAHRRQPQPLSLPQSVLRLTGTKKAIRAFAGLDRISGLSSPTCASIASAAAAIGRVSSIDDGVRRHAAPPRVPGPPNRASPEDSDHQQMNLPDHHPRHMPPGAIAEPRLQTSTSVSQSSGSPSSAALPQGRPKTSRTPPSVRPGRIHTTTITTTAAAAAAAAAQPAAVHSGNEPNAHPTPASSPPRGILHHAGDTSSELFQLRRRITPDSPSHHLRATELRRKTVVQKSTAPRTATEVRSEYREYRDPGHHRGGQRQFVTIPRAILAVGIALVCLFAGLSPGLLLFAFVLAVFFPGGLHADEGSSVGESQLGCRAFQHRSSLVAFGARMASRALADSTWLEGLMFSFARSPLRFSMV
jgi:hypothetical protein